MELKIVENQSGTAKRNNCLVIDIDALCCEMGMIVTTGRDQLCKEVKKLVDFGLPQRAVAKKLGISQSTVSRLNKIIRGPR